MSRTRTTSIVSFVLLGVAALVLLGLGVRSVATERAVAERSARDRLAARLADARGRLDAAAETALARARRGVGDAVARDGAFVRPAPPRTLERLTVPPGRDPYGAWFLEQGEEAELREGDAARAAELYRAVVDGATVDEDHRRLAHLRLSARARAAGDADAADEHARRFLDGLGEARRGTLVPALLLRVELADPDDAALVDDLLAAVGGPDDAVARGLLRRLGVPDERIAARDAEASRLRRLAPWLGRDGGPEDVLLLDERVAARVARDDGTFAFAEEPLPSFDRVDLLRRPADRTPDRAEHVVEVQPLARFPGVRLVAASPRAALLAAADGRSSALVLALVALVVAGGLAVRQTLAAARRETEAAAARERFLQRVGHDLRTPLTLVRMYTETLADGRVDDAAEAREFAGIAAREASRLARMVDGVLDLNRLERDGAAPGRPVDAGALVRDVVDAHRPLLEEARLALSFEPPPAAATVTADPDALRGAVGNLVENAVKYAPDGGVVEVRVERTPAAVRVVVADRGPGFPAGREDEMFERFARSDGTAVPGTGLGLALVREVARRHGGDATARNRAGGGAEVTLSLPRAAEDDS